MSPRRDLSPDTFPAHMWNVFISYASEEREAVAAPLANALTVRGLTVWCADRILRLGDKLGRSIDEGLAKSRFGAVILSEAFFAKEWPRRELDALFSLENGSPRILPMWHDIGIERITYSSPMLADRIAISTRDSIDTIAQRVSQVVGPTPKLATS